MAIDLGTTTGFAWRPMGVLVSGIWSLKPGKYDGAGMRLVKLMAALDQAHGQCIISHIAFEAVRRHLGTDAAHAYGALMGCLQMWCESQSPPVPYQGLPVGEIKKFWTGHGNAPKDDTEKEKRNVKARAKNRKEYVGESMVGEAVRRGYAPVDDNEADALALLHLMEAGV